MKMGTKGGHQDLSSSNNHMKDEMFMLFLGKSHNGCSRKERISNGKEQNQGEMRGEGFKIICVCMYRNKGVL